MRDLTDAEPGLINDLQTRGMRLVGLVRNQQAPRQAAKAPAVAVNQQRHAELEDELR